VQQRDFQELAKWIFCFWYIMLENSEEYILFVSQAAGLPRFAITKENPRGMAGKR
jgi:hypothetical protein